MIRVKFLKDFPERRPLDGGYKDFWYLLGNTWQRLEEDGDHTPPFRDAESVRLIREVDHAEFVDGDWYSMVTPHGRACLSALSSGTQYGLVAIYHSRHGRYTWFQNVGENVWKVLAALSMEILIAIPLQKMNEDYRRDPPIWKLAKPVFIAENLPMKDVTGDVVIHSHDFQWDPSDMRPHMNIADLPYYDFFRYHWTEDLDRVLRILREEIREPMLPAASGVACSEEELWAILQGDASEWMETWGKDRPAVVNHMHFRPKKPCCRRPKMLIVEEHQDGTYVLRDELTVKWPEYSELLWEMLDMRKAQCQQSVLIVDVDETLESFHDLKYAHCGFVISEDQIHLLDREEAIFAFVDALTRAKDSGNVRRRPA